MNRTRNIVKVIAFLVVLVILHALLRQAYYALITPRNSYLLRQQEFTAHKGAYEVALFGDSHALISVQPKILGNAANLSQLGEGYIVRYYKLRYNLRKSPGKLKTIILPMDLHSFSPAWGENFHEVSSSRYVNFADYLWHSGFSTKAMENFVHYYLFPYADCTKEIEDALPAKQKAKREESLARLGLSLEGAITNHDQVNSLMTQHYGKKREWLSQKSLLYFNRIKALCQENNIRVVFVRFPVSRQYVEAASKIVPIDEFDAVTRDLVAAWPGAILLDYRELYFEHDEFFFDLNHLNGRGSNAFSERFRADLTDLGALHASYAEMHAPPSADAPEN